MRRNRNETPNIRASSAPRGPGRTKKAEAKLERPERRAAGKPLARPNTESAGERIAKIIARAGLCSRRDAEAWIAQGRVCVNGRVLTSPAVTVDPADHVTVDGKPLAQRQRTRLFVFHKPRGLVTTDKDPEGRATIFAHLREHAPEMPRLMSIGRLDINTEGLLLLTNDGGLARILELPSTGWLRRYRVRARGETTQAALDALGKGVTIDGMSYAGIEAKLDRQQGANCWLTMGLREGKNREIKRVLEHLGLNVNRLIRLSFGPFQLGELGEGAIEEVRTKVLRDQLGPALAAAAGVDFDTPLDSPPAQKREPAARKPHRPPRRKPAKREPEPEKIRERPSAGPRKHVSALRSKSESRQTQDRRQRVEHGEIADRKGRRVEIERRVVAAKAPAKSSTKSAPRPRAASSAPPTRAPKPRTGKPPSGKPGGGGKGRRTK